MPVDYFRMVGAHNSHFSEHFKCCVIGYSCGCPEKQNYHIILKFDCKELIVSLYGVYKNLASFLKVGDRKKEDNVNFPKSWREGEGDRVILTSISPFIHFLSLPIFYMLRKSGGGKGELFDN